MSLPESTRLTMLRPIAIALPLIAGVLSAQRPSSARIGSLTDVPGLAVGHAVMAGRPTGCTVIVARAGAVGGVDVRGAAPGTRETDLLRPENMVQQVHAIVLTGGSAFGLESATGTVRWLEEQGIGFPVGVGKVPIVPAAVLFDLPVGGDWTIRPNADCGYRAAASAATTPVVEGDVGAGAGATVGKSAGASRLMKAGIGSASFARANGLIVGALAAVNAFGDVIDPATGRVIAGVRSADGTQLADARVLFRGGNTPVGALGGNTTLVVIGTNAKLTKAEATKVAQMAHDGLARALWPVHTPFDGDVVFTMATGTLDGAADVTTIGMLAADAAAAAIIRGATQSRGLPGIPSAASMSPPPSPSQRR